MVGKLLLRGMLVGIVAGLLSFAFLKVAGEPQVDRAIAFETQMDEAQAKADTAMAKGMPMPMQDAGDEIVSRSTQAGIGLFTGVGSTAAWARGAPGRPRPWSPRWASSPSTWCRT